MHNNIVFLFCFQNRPPACGMDRQLLLYSLHRRGGWCLGKWWVACRDEAHAAGYSTELLPVCRACMEWWSGTCERGCVQSRAAEQMSLRRIRVVRNQEHDLQTIVGLPRDPGLDFFHSSDPTQGPWSGGGSFYRTRTCQASSSLPKMRLASYGGVPPPLHVPLPHPSFPASQPLWPPLVHGWPLTWLRTPWITGGCGLGRRVEERSFVLVRQGPWI